MTKYLKIYPLKQYDIIDVGRQFVKTRQRTNDKMCLGDNHSHNGFECIGQSVKTKVSVPHRRMADYGWIAHDILEKYWCAQFIRAITATRPTMRNKGANHTRCSLYRRAHAERT